MGASQRNAGYTVKIPFPKAASGGDELGAPMRRCSEPRGVYRPWEIHGKSFPKKYPQ